MAKTIAIIDDSSVMRSILRKSIMMSGIDVADLQEAGNGQEGLSLIESNTGKLDLIITDLDMPTMTGVEMMEKIKSSGLKTAPIVVISTVGDEKMRETCKSLGAVDFLNKPFSHEDIQALLEKVLK